MSQSPDTCSLATCPLWDASRALCSLSEIDNSTPLPNSSLVLTSLEIGRQLAESGATTFRTQGTCMYPAVRPGDVLHISPCAVDQVTVGDLAVCRRPGYLFCHRVIEVGMDENGRGYLLTRPDTVKSGSDGPTLDGDLLGVVTAIERGGKQTTTAAAAPNWLEGKLLSARLAVINSWPGVKTSLARRIRPLQASPPYRALARLGLRFSGARLAYQVRLPVRLGQMNDLYQVFDPQQFEVSQPTFQGSPPQFWQLALLLDGKKQPAAQVCLALHPADCPKGAGWHAHGFFVRARYRGLGFTEDLLDEAGRILARGGVALAQEVR